LEEEKAKVLELLKVDPFANQRAQIEKLDKESNSLKAKIALSTTELEVYASLGNEPPE